MGSGRPDWKSERGLTLYACVGPYDGFFVGRRPGLGAYSIVLGWVSITLMTKDIECWTGNLIRFADWITGHDLHLVDLRHCATCDGTWVMRQTVDGTPKYCPHCGGSKESDTNG